MFTWSKLHINTTSEKHERQVIRFLERSKKVRNIEVTEGAVHYEQKGWVDEEH